MPTVFGHDVILWKRSCSWMCLLFVVLSSRLWHWTSSVRPSVWILGAELHHRVLPDPPPDQLRRPAVAQIRERVSQRYTARRASQSAAGRLFFSQTGSCVTRQHVCGSHKQRWGWATRFDANETAFMRGLDLYSISVREAKANSSRLRCVFTLIPITPAVISSVWSPKRRSHLTLLPLCTHCQGMK